MFTNIGQRLRQHIDLIVVRRRRKARTLLDEVVDPGRVQHRRIRQKDVVRLNLTGDGKVPAGRAGIASGINNAVLRLAGVLAIAILGIVMLNAFERHLAQDAAQINLAPQIRNELDGQRIKLAAIGIPEQIDTATRERIKRSIDESFVAGFRVVMLIASGLALASAVTAWSVIRDKP